MQNKLLKFLLLYLLFAIYFLTKYLTNPLNGKDFIVFLNSGNGDSILLASDSNYLLLDGGANSSSSENLYKYTNYKVPSNYAISHFHLDHISSFIKVLNSPNTFYDIYTPRVFIDKKEYTKYFFNLSHKNFISLSTQDTIKVGSLMVNVLHPDTNCKYTNDLNDCSLSLLVKKANLQVLLSSDNDTKVQNRYLHQLGDTGLLIKVPHQGSVDSLNKELLTKFNPKYAVFSVGENKYGHPKKEVVDYYISKNIKTYITKDTGDVVVVLE